MTGTTPMALIFSFMAFMCCPSYSFDYESGAVSLFCFTSGETAPLL
jgi:hypothetical protein